MGTRASKSTALRKLEGNLGKRPLPENEPEPLDKAPECPEDLSESAKEVWHELAPKLERIGLLSEIDGAVLSSLCQIRANLIKIHKQYSDEGEVLIIKETKPDGSTTTRPNPLLTMARQNYQLLKSLCGELGLSPRGRVGLSVGVGKTKDEGEDLLS